MKKNILVTGGLGFIGTNLIKKLLEEKSYNIHVLAHNKTKITLVRSKNLKIHYGNILKKSDIDPLVRRVDIIIHLAGSTTLENGVLNIIKTNILGTTLLLESSRQNNSLRKIIILSSSGVYREGYLKKLLKEDDPLEPFNLYTASKLAIEKIARVYYVRNHLPIVILRPFNVYGPHQALKKPIPLFITRFIQNKKIVLNYEGKPLRDWIYVDDLVEAIKKITLSSNKRLIGNIFNVATGKSTSIREIVELIQILLRKNTSNIKIQKQSEIPEPMYNVGDPTKLKNMIGWRPTYSVEEGIRKTIKWYKQTF